MCHKRFDQFTYDEESFQPSSRFLALCILSCYPRRGAIVDCSLLVTDYMDMGTGYHQTPAVWCQSARAGPGLLPGCCAARTQSGVTLRHNYLTAISGYDIETSQPFSSI